jgi:phosphatidylinositol-3-phosphatase
VSGACGGNSNGGVDATSTGDSSLGNADGNPDAVSGDGSTAQPIIFTIVMENHDYAEIVGSDNAPYVNALIAQYGLATNYRDTIHPSLGNYLHMISGDNQYPGVIDVGPNQAPWFPAKKANLGTQLEAAGIKWRAYAESMGTPCKLVDAGKYVPRHVPFVYFDDMQNGAGGLCSQRVVDYANFVLDLAGGDYRFMWITPNQISNGHDPFNDPVGALITSDNWLKAEVPRILASSGWKAGGLLLITWDEAEGRNGNDDHQVPMIVISPKIKQAGMTSATAFTHASYLATVEDLLGLPRLPTVTNTPNLLEFVQ